MPRNGERNADGDNADHPGNVTHESHEKNHDKKKHKRYNPYGNRSRNQRYYGKNQYNGTTNNEKRNFKKARFEVGERLKETDLGITEYAGDAEGFDGTIKERFTDFVVHEISVDGQIAQLTNQEIPADPKEPELEELVKKIPENIWKDLQRLAVDEHANIEIDVTDISREQRKYIHMIVKKMTTVTSETKDVDSKKLIVFTKGCNKRDGSRDNRQDWSDKGGDYCHFVLHKVNMDTMDALNQMAKALRLKSTVFNYSGTKDRRAKTSQWISVKKMSPRTIMKAARSVRGAFVGNFKFEKEPLKLGKLEGNMFTIAIRNVTAPNDVIEKALVALRDKGFINYYGLQRFGTVAAIPTHDIGKALLQGNWEEAIDLILKPREGEQDTDLSEAREIYKNTKDSRLAYQKINRNDKIEAKVLWGLNVYGQKNLQGALDMVPRNTMLMYVHAYQSLIWNKMVSRRIKEYGLVPVVGDLVYENSDSKDDDHVHELEDDAKSQTEESNDNEEKSKDTIKKENSVTLTEVKTEILDKSENESKPDEKEESENKDSKSEKDKSNEKDPIPVKVLTQEDLANYTISDIIMPQPGWKVTYPTYAKQWFEEQLEKDGLTVELKQKNKKYTLSGSYRKIMQIPQKIEWEIFSYNNKTADLILSDLDKLRNKDPVEIDPEGKMKALVIKMSLKSSSYATMALRELLKCDTSSQTHAAQSAAFHEAHEKNEQEKKNAEALKISNNGEVNAVEDENDKTASISATSSSLEDSVEENAPKHSSSMNGTHKHEVDPVNDSGIDTSTHA